MSKKTNKKPIGKPDKLSKTINLCDSRYCELGIVTYDPNALTILKLLREINKKNKIINIELNNQQKIQLT